MKRMIVRNRVKDFDTWKEIFDEQLVPAKEHGLTLENLWRDINEPNNVFFIFQVETMEGANGFVTRPESAEAGEKSGVVDGEMWIVE
ncbi:MAG: hypothetical protein HKN23_00395 [Verrucomicrobiales bacterium]|nr:hypothetical protein [Verrucomicrobiales bacterium]